MTTRADLIKAGAAAARLNGVGSWEHLAAVVLDAVLPQITTVEQLEALPIGSVLLGSSHGRPVIGEQTKDGPRFHGWLRSPSGVEADLRGFGPLTVVWQPSVDRVTT